MIFGMRIDHCIIATERARGAREPPYQSKPSNAGGDFLSEILACATLDRDALSGLGAGVRNSYLFSQQVSRFQVFAKYVYYLNS